MPRRRGGFALRFVAHSRRDLRECLSRSVLRVGFPDGAGVSAEVAGRRATFPPRISTLALCNVIHAIRSYLIARNKGGFPLVRPYGKGVYNGRGAARISGQLRGATAALARHRQEIEIPHSSRDATNGSYLLWGAERRCKMKTKGQLEAEISEAIIKFEKEYMGRGPEETRTYIIDDMVLVRLRGVLTPAEKNLAKIGSSSQGRALIKQVRIELLEKARCMLEALVQDITGRRMRSLHTDISTSTGERVIIFTMDGAPQFKESEVQEES